MTIRKRLGSAAILVALAAPACEQDLLKPNTQSTPPDSPEAVVTVLQRAYEKRSLALLGSILAVDPARHAVFRFYLSEPTELGEIEWDHDEEVRLHHRMFRPEDHVRDSTPVWRDLWLNSISVHLTRLEAFAEIPDLYSADQGQDGKLDPALWRAVGARYDTEAFFDLAGDGDYQVHCEARFIIIEDLAKHVGDPGKFFLYEWDDAPPRSQPRVGGAPMTEPRTWSEIKSLYR